MARFDARGALVALGGYAVVGPRHDLWRAPTDNDSDGDRVVDGWRAVGRGVRLDVETTPLGGRTTTMPRIGLRMDVPAGLDTLTWFGLGPGEAYADTGRAAHVGRFTRTVAELQTPYVFPQENGNRNDVRWARLIGPGGTGRDVLVRPGCPAAAPAGGVRCPVLGRAEPHLSVVGAVPGLVGAGQ